MRTIYLGRAIVCFLLSLHVLTHGLAQDLALPEPERANMHRGGGLPPAINLDLPAHQGQFQSAQSTSGGGRVEASGYRLRGAIGQAVLAGGPDFLFGDEIHPPLEDIVGNALTLTEARAYWRPEPMEPGELVKLGGATVTPVPEEFVPRYYYSPHAEAVFASFAGRVVIQWRKRTPIDLANNFAILEMEYKIAASSRRPVRRMYWTEGSYTGPTVNIPASVVSGIEIIYNDDIPETVMEDGVEQPTFWFDESQGLFSLHAFRRQGKVLVEYLGGAGDGSREHLGIEVVRISQETLPVEVTTLLGERLYPKADGITIDARVDQLEGSHVSLLGVGEAPFVQDHTENGQTVHYAIRENLEPRRVQFYWLERGLKDVRWPTYLNSYEILWPDGLEGFHAHMARPSDSEASADTVGALPLANTPELIYQDDETGLQAKLDFEQRLQINLGDDDDSHRSLLRFSAGDSFWYVRLYAADESLLGDLDKDSDIDLQAMVDVGSRIEPPEAADSVAGYIDPKYGTAYDAESYINPFLAGGVEGAEAGSIIPVNALPGNDRLRVWWFEKLTPPEDRVGLVPVYFPAYVGEYTLRYPEEASEIVMASNLGSGDLPEEISVPEIYYQNDPSQPGYNPNEEHALLANGRAYALRDDLNVPHVSSEPFVLVRYEDLDSRPSIKPYRVLRENEDYQFNYQATAGTLLQAPAPLPFMPLPLEENGQSRNKEVYTNSSDGPVNAGVQITHPHYGRFTYEDRKGRRWVYRGPHRPELDYQPILGAQFFYRTQEGFAFPSASDGADQPEPIGTIVPYLRPLDEDGNPVGDGVSGSSLTIHYVPRWPDQVPELRFGETLALPKFGLPQVRGQQSVQVIYEGSLARDFSFPSSVRLYDPTRRKYFYLGSALDKLPTSIATASLRGKTYFQNLASHLQDRFYFDPLLGENGALVLEGRFVDEVVGEDYLLPNVLSSTDVAQVRALCDPEDTRKSDWDQAVVALRTTIERFIEDPAVPGTYIVDPDGSHQTFSSTGTPRITHVPTKPFYFDQDPEGLYDEAVDSFALSAVGGGTGYVTLMTGNGRAFTAEEEPVSVHVFRVGGGLYQGELKPVVAANPLSENVTVQHTGDFAGEPNHYEFEWRKAAPVDGLSPDVFRLHSEQVVTSNVAFAERRDPVADADGDYSWSDTGATMALPASVTINTDVPGSGDPGLSLLGSVTLDPGDDDVDQVYLGISTNVNDGLAVLINGAEAIRYQISDPSSVPLDTVPDDIASLMGGIQWVFALDPSWFHTDGATPNTVELVYWSGTGLGEPTLLDFRVAVTLEEDLTNGTYQAVTSGVGQNRYLVSGTGIDVLSDNYYIMRYRPVGEHSHDGWSRWTRPALVEGWIKRVLAGINPFNQRLSDFFENAVNTDVSLIAQAGKRWEGDVALNLDNIQDVGLIEIYETVLKRGAKLSIEGSPPQDHAPANDALLLAAGYLADLYTFLGNEAYADASNPTILIDANTARSLGASADLQNFDAVFNDTATARFAFQGQVASLLDEELALLRGRTDSLAPGVEIQPAYNRLFWNYTRGINAGEVIYALNYNISEKDGDDADGVVDAADAQRLFPQGHGDAYGHYLTALSNYYRLLANPSFTWEPRSEAVNVLGQPVSVDYLDERKFAGAASALARTASQIQSLEHRKAYPERDAVGWAHLRAEGETDKRGRPLHWKMDDWSSRGGQGAYYHWVTANAILPHEDAEHEGIQKIDRTTVPELDEVVRHAEAIQEQMNGAESGLNPLDLTDESVVFDISPSELNEGQTHFEQVYARAKRALGNAFEVFDRASESNRLLRSIANQDHLANDIIVDQERAFKGQLKAIFGTPYAGDMGPGKTYDQDYDGPDLYRYMYIDRPFDVFSRETLFGSTNQSREVTLLVRDDALVDSFSKGKEISAGGISPVFSGISIEEESVFLSDQGNSSSAVSYTVRDDDGPYQFAESRMGKRQQLGTLQDVMARVRLTEERFLSSLHDADKDRQDFLRKLNAIEQDLVSRSRAKEFKELIADGQVALDETVRVVQNLRALALSRHELHLASIDIQVEALPKVNGASNDTTSSARAGLLGGALAVRTSHQWTGFALRSVVNVAEASFATLKRLREKAIGDEEGDIFFRAKEEELRSLYDQALAGMRKVDSAQVAYTRALEAYQTEFSKGQALLAERESYRKRAAAVVQGYRTRDVAFRAFRTEALEQYRNLFDQAARYAFLASQAYDYETGLLDSSDGRAFLGSIVSSRALGLLNNEGEPSFAGGSSGDAGLSGLLAKLSADWEVAEGRLGFNNPDRYGTAFSLRREALRIPEMSSGDGQWQEALSSMVVDNLLADADVAAHALQLSSDGNPVPGIIVPFRTQIATGLNFFGQPLAVGDSRFTETNFATKIRSVGVVFDGYKGMMPCLVCDEDGNDGPDTSSDANALAATPHVFLLPAGADVIRPPSSHNRTHREWQVLDLALPYPYDIGSTDASQGLTWDTLATANEGFLNTRRHQAFRAVGSRNFFFSQSHTDQYTSSRLVGRSVENTQWKLVIPAKELLNDASDGLRRFINSVSDIQVYFQTYSHAGH